MARHRLRFRRPATTWTEALPLGNGRLGAMALGDPGCDRFALNDDTLWSGSPASELAGGAVPAEVARAALARARAALAAGDRAGADAAVRELQQRYTQAYLPLGDLLLTDPTWGDGDVVRSLDLSTATHELRGRSGQTDLIRTCYVSATDGVLVIDSYRTDPGDLRLGLTTPLRGEVTASPELLLMTVRAPVDAAPTHARVEDPVRYDEDQHASVQAAVAVTVTTDGTVAVDGEELVVRGARHVRVLLATATTFVGIGRAPDGDLAAAQDRATRALADATSYPPAELVSRHRAEHARLYDRTEVRFEATTPSEPEVDTADRLAAARAQDHPLAADPDLAALLLHYGRYLLICSSRPGTLPATLQGIWNEQVQPPWSSNYTVNINAQMNYWGAEVAALPELVEPLVDLVEALAVRGEEVARRLYDRPGWAAHHNTDAWAYASPVGLGRDDPSWAFWPMAAPWLLRHLGEALAHGAPDALAERAWPLVRGAAAFVLAWLEPDADGVLGTPLSTSPENTLVVLDDDGDDVGTASVARSSAMDLELSRDVLLLLVRLADTTGRPSEEIVAEARAALPRIPAPAIGPDGGVQEWGDGELARDPHHRHVSMLYGLFPGDRDLSAAERSAAGRSLDLRGDDSSGWSLVWKTALRARLRQPHKVQDLLALMFRDATVTQGEWAGGLYPNLFAAHPPFQIDANLGYVGALLEALVQSHDGRITLLPALPPVLATGSARGLRVRPGVGLDLTWAGGDLVEAVLASETDRTVTLAWRERSTTLALVAGVPLRVGPADLAGSP